MKVEPLMAFMVSRSRRPMAPQRCSMTSAMGNRTLGLEA